MARYYFNLLLSGCEVATDPHGLELPDEASARNYGIAVAQELKKHRENQTRHWCLIVCDEERMPRFNLMFADIDDDVMAQYPLELRDTVRSVSKRTASLSGAIVDVQRSMLQLRATLARADREPYLAAVSGVRI